MRRREPHDLLTAIAVICLFFAFDEGKTTSPNYLLLIGAAVAFALWLKLEFQSAAAEQNSWRLVFMMLAIIAAVAYFCCSL